MVVAPDVLLGTLCNPSRGDLTGDVDSQQPHDLKLHLCQIHDQELSQHRLYTIILQSDSHSEFLEASLVSGPLREIPIH